MELLDSGTNAACHTNEEKDPNLKAQIRNYTESKTYACTNGEMDPEAGSSNQKAYRKYETAAEAQTA